MEQQAVTTRMVYTEFSKAYVSYKERTILKYGEKVWDFSELLANAVMANILIDDVFATIPQLGDIAINVINAQELNNMALFMKYGVVDADLRKKAIEAFKENYESAAQRVRLLYRVNLPPASRYVGEGTPGEEAQDIAESSAETESVGETPQSPSIIIAKN